MEQQPPSFRKCGQHYINVQFLDALYGARKITAQQRSAVLGGVHPSSLRLSAYDVYWLTATSPIRVPVRYVGDGTVDDAELGHLKGASSNLQRQIDDVWRALGSKEPAPNPWDHIPTGIPATSIGGGNVDDTEFGYLDGVTGPIQNQLNGKLASNGNGSALTNINATNITSGTLNAARLPSGISAAKVGGGSVDDTEFGYLDGVTGPIQNQLNGKQATLTLPLLRSNGGLGSDISALGNGLLVQTAPNVWAVRSLTSGTGTTVNNADGTAGNLAVNVTYGSLANTATQGNDTRLPPAPSGAGKLPYDNGSAYVALSAGTAGRFLRANGVAPPAWDDIVYPLLRFRANMMAASGTFYGGMDGDWQVSPTNRLAILMPNPGLRRIRALALLLPDAQPGGITITVEAVEMSNPLSTGNPLGTAATLSLTGTFQINSISTLNSSMSSTYMGLTLTISGAYTGRILASVFGSP